MTDTDEQRKQDEEAAVEGHLRRLNEQDSEADDPAPDIDVEGHMRRLNEQDSEADDQAPDVEGRK